MSQIATITGHTPSTTVLTIAANVRAEVARFGLTDAEFAADLGMTAMSVSRRLNGHTPFTTAEVDAIAAYFGVPVGDFFSPTLTRKLAALRGDSAANADAANQRTSDYKAAVSSMSDFRARRDLGTESHATSQLA